MRRRHVLIWCQHLLGTGHFQRCRLLATALMARKVDVTLVSGGPSLPFLLPEGLRFVQLPAIKVSDTTFSSLVNEHDEPVTEEHWSARRARLAEALDHRPVAALVTEMFPFGRRAFRAEVCWLIEHARTLYPSTKIVCSVRDILVSKNSIDRYQWMSDTCRKHYDTVLVHGDPEFVSFEDSPSFLLADQLSGYLQHTGYIVDLPAFSGNSGRSGVIVSAGGGAVGGDLIRTALGVIEKAGQRFGPWTILRGSRAGPADISRLRSGLPHFVTIENHVADLPQRLRRSSVSVSQAGYNTVAETLATSTPLVLVPFEALDEDEQRRRADATARLGRGVIVAQEELCPERLADAIDRALSLPTEPSKIRMDGADVAADSIVRLIG